MKEKKEIIRILAEKNIGHPIVDDIFKHLNEEIPALSKSSVYNSMMTFIHSRLVRILAIGDSETKYDVITESHGHFM